MKTIFLSIFQLLLLSPAALQASSDLHLTFSQIGTREGLTQNTVRAILEDSKGFIWAGTLDGLNRYDGYNLVSYKPQPGKSHSLADHRVKDIFRDSRGYLWIKTYNNEFSCYDPVTDSFVSYDSGRKTERPLLYKNYFEDSSGNIWLWGSADDCLRVCYGEGRFVSEAISTGGKETLFILEDSRGDVWIGGEYGLKRIRVNQVSDYLEESPVTGGAEIVGSLYFSTRLPELVEYNFVRGTFRHIPSPEGWIAGIAAMGGNELLLHTGSEKIRAFDTAHDLFFTPEWAEDPRLGGMINLITDKQGCVWIHNQSGLAWYYNPVGKKLRIMELIPPGIRNVIDDERFNVFVDSEGLVWITTYGNGLFCYDSRTDRLHHYKYSSNQNSPASDYLLCITEDRSGNIWIGSEYAGIVKIVKSPYPIRLLQPEPQVSVGKSNNVKSVFLDDSARVWVGTKNGPLYLYDQNLSRGECLYTDLNPYVMVPDGRNRLWVGTKGNGISVLDLDTHRQVEALVNDPRDPRSLSSNQIFSILRDSKNRMWVGTFNRGLCLARETDGKISFDRFFYSSARRTYIRYVFEDSRQRIWVCTTDGLIRFLPEEFLADPEAYRIYRLNLDQPGSINCNDIKTVFEDSRGRIWIGTAGGGLSRYMEATDRETESFIPYTLEDGLAGNLVSGVMEDGSGQLWISTENGITKFDPEKGDFTVYLFSDKTYGNHFNENAHTGDPEGNMYWGSLDGLVVFNPVNFPPDGKNVPVTFTDLFIFDQKAEIGPQGAPLSRSVSYSDAVRLKHFQNTFTLEFSSLAFRDPAKNRYTYFLQNYDKQWSPVSGNNTATYKNLPPGEYTFLVKGTHTDGTWNEEVQRLAITVVPPWWKSTEAYLVYLLLLAAGGVFAFRLLRKFNLLQTNIRVEKELTNHKLRFFTNISHEFRTPLTIIRSVTENLVGQPDTSAYARRQIAVLNRNSNRLTQLIDQLLEFRKIQNNVLRLDLESIDMVAFVHEIFQGFTEIAEQKSIRYTFHTNEEVYSLYVDRRKMDKVVYNLLSNAFKFTPAGGRIDLRLDFDGERKTCRIAVEDNGPGIEKEKVELLFSRFMQTHFSYDGTGVGLSLVKEFVEVHKGKVWYSPNEEPAGGSVFSVELSTDPETYRGENFIPAHQPLPHSREPVLAPALPETEELPVVEIDESALSDYKMLVIDDNDDIRQYLTEEFSRYFLVDSAADGEKGLQKVHDVNPDLILCDVMMTGLDGFEVTRRLREDFRTCHIPIILLTAHSSPEHQVEGIQSGADAYITKPFSIKYLTARVFKLIEQREQLKKRFSSEYVVGDTLINWTTQDQRFVNLLNQVMEENLTDPEFSVGRFAELTRQSRSLFYRKVKGVTGLSPNDFIKVKRLNRAAELLLKGELTVSEISYQVGFEDPYYFSKCFKAQFKCTPSKYNKEYTDQHFAGIRPAEEKDQAV